MIVTGHAARAPVPSQTATNRFTPAAALLAPAAVAAVALAAALSGGPSSDATPAAVRSQPALRADGGPDESVVAAALDRHGTARQSESARRSRDARGAAPSAQRPDESRVGHATQSR